MTEFTIEEAKNFFAEYFYGEHHIPEPIKPAGYGYKVSAKYLMFATHDDNGLTRLVLMAHKYGIRVEICSNGMQGLTLMIHKRQLDAQDVSKGHPSLKTLVERIESIQNT